MFPLHRRLFSPAAGVSLLFAVLFCGAARLDASMPMIEFPRPIEFRGRQIVLDGVDTSGLGAGTILRFRVKQIDGYATFTTETDAQGRFTIALDATALLDRDGIRVAIERNGVWLKRLATVRRSRDSASNAVPSTTATNFDNAICTTCGSGTCSTFSPDLFTTSNAARDGDVQLADLTVLTDFPVFAFPTRLMGFELVLHHQSQTTYAGLLGESWSHTYNTFIVEVGESEAWFVASDLSVFRFERQQGTAGGSAVWNAPEGFFGKIERNETLQRWVFTHATGTRFEFLIGLRGLPGPLLAIAEPNGNQTQVRLDPSGFISKVVTDLGQTVTFEYSPQGRLTSVTDPIQRRWLFGYRHGNLRNVLPPPTDAVDLGPGQEITDRDLPGALRTDCVRATVFEYDDPRWPHHISAVLDPRGAASVAYTYTGEGRVAARTVNGRPLTYVYGPAADEEPRPLPALDPGNSITRVIDRAGNVVDHEMHGAQGGPVGGKGAFGLRRRVEWTERGKGNAPLRPSSEPEYRERRWLHDCDCLSPLKVSQPFPSDAALQFDNHKMPIGYPTEVFEYNDRRQVTGYEYRGGPGEVIREERTYAPSELFSRMLTYTEPRAFDDSPLYQGLSFTHTYEYESETGNLLAHTSPAVTLGVPGPQSIRETWTYNQRGQVLSYQDPNDNLTTHTYFSGPVSGGDVNTKGEFDGYLSAITRGAAGSADPEAGLTTRFKVNALGMVTERTDRRGFVYTTEYNDLGEVTREIEPAVTLENGQQVRYETQFLYDGAGNLVIERRSNIDLEGTVPANDFVDRSWSWDVADNRLSERVEIDEDDAHDLVTRFAYEENDKLSVIQRPEGNRTFLTYDSWRLPFKTFYGVAPGQSPVQSYPVDKRADSLGGTFFVGVTVTDYDARGNAVRQQDGRGNSALSFFDFRNRRVAERDANGNGAVFSFDDASNLVREERGAVSAAGAIAELLARTYHRYDEAGRRHETALDVDLASDESAGVEPDDGRNSAYRTAFDPGGRTVQRLDTEGNPTFYSFDAADRATEERDALGNRRRFVYDENSNLVRIEEIEVPDLESTIAEFYVTTFDFDEVNRRVAMHVRGLDESIDHETTYAYDSRGNRRRVRDAEANFELSSFDDQDRLVRFQRFEADGVTELVHHEHAYDRNGNTVVDLALSDVTDPASAQATRYAYDTLDRRVRTVYPDSDDPIDGSGNGPDGTYDRVETAYDANSNATSVQEQRGVRITNSYDLGNRLTAVDVIPPASGLAGERRRVFAYDALDRVTEASNDFARTERAYDPLSRLIADTQSVRLDGSGFAADYVEPVAVESTYDRQGNRLTTAVRDGGATVRDLEVQRTFDALNRVESLAARHFAEEALEPVADYTYFGPSRIKRKTLGNGAQLENTYDAKRRVARHVWQVRGGATAAQILAGFEYEYDDVDNALFERFLHDGGRFDNFGYNPRYELTGASFAEGSAVDYRTSTAAFDDQFVYDDIFNRREAIFGGTEDDYEANPANEYTEIVRNGTPFVPVHDAAGNAVALPVRPVAETEAGRDVAANALYDAFNQLFEIQAGANPRQHYRYDAFGRRIAILELRATTPPTFALWGSKRLVYDGWNEAEERLLRPGLLVGATSTLERVYVHGPRIDEVLLTAIDGNGDRTVSGVTTHAKNTPGGPDWEYYTLDNRMGSIMALLGRDQAGRLLETYRYDAFGEPSILFSIVSSGPVLSPAINPFLFTGRRLDGESGLYHYRARYMEPASGRFLQRDPAGGLQSTTNLYTLGRNNPVVFLDPSGFVEITQPQLWLTVKSDSEHWDIRVFAVLRFQPEELRKGFVYWFELWESDPFWDDKLAESPNFVESAFYHDSLVTFVDIEHVKHARCFDTEIGNEEIYAKVGVRVGGQVGELSEKSSEIEMDTPGGLAAGACIPGSAAFGTQSHALSFIPPGAQQAGSWVTQREQTTVGAAEAADDPVGSGMCNLPR